MLTNATIKNQWYIQMFILQQVHLIFPWYSQNIKKNRSGYKLVLMIPFKPNLLRFVRADNVLDVEWGKHNKIRLN
jgi:hypothetical protein